MFKVFILLVLSLLGLLHSSVGQIIQNGQCDQDFQLASNFEYETFLGTWYELHVSDSQSRDCSYYEFETLDISSYTYTVTRNSVIENFDEVLNGTGFADNGTAKLTLDWEGASESVDFWVSYILTDVNPGVAVTYKCVNTSSQERSISLWVLSKDTAPLTTNFFALISTHLTTYFDVTIESLRDVSHSESACYRLPTIAAGNPIILPGQCESLSVVQNFDVANFTGVWHEVASYPSDYSENRCSRAQYTLDAGVVDIVNSQVINEELAIITGTAIVASTDGSARLNVTLNVESGVAEQDLWILATDYSNYAISYTCINLSNDTRRVYSWILSRTRRLSASAQAAVNEKVASEIVLNSQYYQDADQSDDACFFYPEPVPGVPVVFRGSCDESIPVVQNFNATAYMGVWHDIESYPSVFQTGDCKNANYALGDVVDVFNTQVINQTLDTMRGVAILVTDDGSAKLSVSFPIAGLNATTTTDYWVLDTDYTSYALVYTCAELPVTEERQIWSWKLSRTKQLTPAAASAINNTIENIPVLDQRYFQSVDQSPTGCFYYPEPQLGVPVVFPGQCDDSVVEVVQNFDLNRFNGIWHEIEAYPKDEQQGQCVRHQYTNNSDTLSLQSSQVIGQYLRVSNGTLGFSNSSDNSARLTITLDSGIEIPFWILSIDYEDYALAYSCVNRDDDFRAVYSWKLSRTQQLSPNAVTVINSVISDVQVLRQNYYEPLDHSEAACFYLPELAEGQPVILEGQCDLNITVVANFNAARYLGRWRLIESYASEFQSGACNEATYSLNNESNVDVFNTQVVNQTLYTINGYATVEDNAKLLVYFPDADSPSEYWILDTDYDSYALVYSCKNLNSETRQVWSWKMSRSKSLTPQAVTAINQIIDTINVLFQPYYKEIDHSDEGCFFFPEPDLTTPVRFRGTCDQSIAAVPNFNVTRYSGLWHNIELYPSVFQGGSCNNAFYSLAADGVEVFNTQVLSQTLDTMTGLAVLASTDGSAKLNVTFPVAGTNFTVTTNYWVLDTDYDSYSLVYTCEDLEDEQRLVYSWKLSRTKQLTTGAAQTINNKISDIQVLDDRYYREVDQSPDGCFFYPEPELGIPVVFPGQCDNTINATTNFNLTRFQGVWYEIQAYPKSQVQGDCANHEYYASTATSLTLQSSQVYDQSLIVSSGSLSFASEDNSGKMTIAINVNGTAITIPFWILSTDYDDYALAYSCVDNTDDTRAVYSWKLSRSKELSPNATTTINEAMQAVDVLEGRYFENIDQSDPACFYLPDLDSGEPVVFPGQCDTNITVVQNFRAADYLGTWRLIESYHSDFQSGSCNQATYSLKPNGAVDVFNTQVINETLYTITGEAIIASDDGSGKLLVTFPDSGSPTEYWILDTDYTSYSLVYSCENLAGNQRRVWSWKLSRNDSLTETANNQINEKINSIEVLNNRFYEAIAQTEETCFYFPDPEPNTPVKLRGRCNQDIEVVRDFQPERYLGLWHNIELYPSVFQGGSCNNAFYSLAADGVDLFNTQVVNQTLDTMTGLAVLASNGTGKLIVTFPVVGTNLTVSLDYWIIDTDYDSYSLVYTCDEFDDEYKLVYSWKLSRTKQLTENATEAINNKISTIKELDERYYNNVDQSADGCFYFPEPQPGVPVVFPGSCDSNIAVVQIFSLSAFEGIWYEIQAYPKDEQQGQCINHEYSAGSGNLLLQSSQVYNQTLNINYGTLNFTSDDNSGKLTITITVDGTAINIPFWILDTDYVDYALAYSCVDQGNDYRSVYSWKLSRNTSLSVAANTSINNVISSVNVLGEQYYEPIDHADEACFYLPDLAPGAPVVFRGQCDETIPAVADFDAARYLGRWRTIETYQSEFQGGTCGQAEYSLANDGSTVNVYNTQVLNQTLDTMTGTAVASTDGTGKLLVNFPTTPETAIYWILATDYESYSLVYSCRNINTEQRQVWAWKLSRERELSQNATDDINAVINDINVLNDRYFENVPQSQAACFYYPEPNGPVHFRGQCNENIAVVQDFDPEAYSGLWYDIESYPQTFQDGTCPKATYNLTGGVVEVLNTQVVNQELDTIKATAVPSSNDGSGKLSVTFPIAGTDLTVTTPYWVLATDYSNFSLVYSCENIDDDYYRVTSWKLSRSPELSNGSLEAIENVKSVVPELRDQYYERNSHSEEACFFYPDNNGGPVYLDGQCDPPSDVLVVTDFDAARFNGTWYEINRFPSELQTGECAATRYDYNQDGFDITNTIVNNERISAFTGRGTLADNTRGVLQVNLNDGAFEEHVFILDTDYDEYALLYSCRNVGSDRKQVYSWKLGRNQAGLSPAAISSIDSVVTNRTYLFENYYEPTGQDSNSCFYYPEFDGSQSSIILPGFCDPNIRGIENFRAENYLGQWYEIYSYPDPNQFGQCARAHYAVGSDVAITNTQVVNRTLLTQEGSGVAAADGSGQLVVTFVVNGETRTANYYVIATDYDNYALVYRCRDIVGANSREVFSWKLSRSSTLSNEANIAMNQAIATTQGLLNDYYQPISQTAADCFYVPEFAPDESVLFRGRCVALAPVIESFEPQRYLNKWWHEIERYPTDTNDGECISTRYHATGNTFEDTRIFANDGRVATGTVTAGANGQIVKTFLDGSTETLWVVATDYDTYALLLSCEDVGDEYIRVWSTKHSSTRSLTQAAENALASVIEDNDLLYQEFYLTVSQSDASCFYYPEQDGQQVILPGQCDENIPTQADFDLTAYVGTWYQIERYPYPEVRANSTCIGTRYTLRDSDNVNVLNWETNGDGLETIAGIGTWTNGTAIITVVLQTDPEDEEATVSTNLHILLTDYVSYSLAYTCRNLDEYNRVVVALKLSRTRGMPATATTSINNYMGTRQELHQPFFLQVAHDEDCEDPSSSFLVKSSIIVTLICLVIQTLM